MVIWPESGSTDDGALLKHEESWALCCQSSVSSDGLREKFGLCEWSCGGMTIITCEMNIHHMGELKAE